MRIEASSALFKGEEEEEQCSSSSIGKNSDLSSETECGGDTENEAQSAYKYNNEPLDMMNSLQQVLPIRRGISKFYDGKSKSFKSLAETVSSSSSVKDIGKPDNAYTRRRRNLMAVNHVWEKNRNGGISKRTMSSSRSALALAFAVNYDSSSNSSCTSEESNPVSPPPLPPRSASPGLSSPMHQNFSGWRSFSLVDLQNCATAATIKMPNSSMRNEAAHLS